MKQKLFKVTVAASFEVVAFGKIDACQAIIDRLTNDVYDSFDILNQDMSVEAEEIKDD